VDQAGFTLVELLVAMLLMLVVLGAAFKALEVFARTTSTHQRFSDSANAARTAMDRLTREMRNATAYQTSSNPTSSAVLVAQPSDLVFKAVDPSGGPTPGNPYGVQTVLYCLAASGNALYRQTKAGALTPGSACPDPAWSGGIVAQSIVNGSRMPFTYGGETSGPITSLSVGLYVDDDPSGLPKEILLRSGVFLRNQNRPPVAAFTAVASSGRHVTLNGSASSDPEGNPLTYKWQDGSTTLPQTGPVVDYVAPSTGNRTFTLTVKDGEGLTDTATTSVVVKS
jgi:prepilin-type N-terminal cleavage/methylation domain-containing protein